MGYGGDIELVVRAVEASELKRLTGCRNREGTVGFRGRRSKARRASQKAFLDGVCYGIVCTFLHVLFTSAEEEEGCRLCHLSVLLSE
jgi:hypothetical protein